ncbi:Succinate dehydrogenase assembly factor 2-B, mitochondrial [Frankliniella fusca]|uniref:Succinate dehydrogenase assembly factor 2-B, mitochondrial n=1 Tax=Frankliniella fusca TaxID=407009 RepID=A0AAE1H8J2_9NEOP|nr:Succinate dehydrogenase assembly factor 2-B, mitochondrial [Frankliniella fusca]
MEEFHVGFSSLTRGVLYPIVKIEKTESKINGRMVQGMKSFVLDDDLQLTTYLPKKVMDKIDDEKFKKINDAGSTDHKWSVCYYGSMGTQLSRTFFGMVHEPGESRSDKLFNDMTKMMRKYSETTPEKRSHEDNTSESGPSKIVKVE